MKAIIVKNNEFETIGFEVTEQSNVLFSWGIAPHSTVFTKEVSEKEYMYQIFQLVRLEAALQEQKCAESRFFDTLKLNNMLQYGVPYKMNIYREEKEKSIKAIERIIQSIK